MSAPVQVHIQTEHENWRDDLLAQPGGSGSSRSPSCLLSLWASDPSQTNLGLTPRSNPSPSPRSNTDPFSRINPSPRSNTDPSAHINSSPRSNTDPSVCINPDPSPRSNPHPSPHSNPDWLPKLTGSFLTLVVEKCSARCRQAVQDDEDITDTRERKLVWNELLNTTVSHLEGVFGDISVPSNYQSVIF